MSASTLNNLLVPFRRDRKQDFASGTGTELLRSKVRQTVLTNSGRASAGGELPWRTRFGADLDDLRHQSNDIVLAELARVRIRDALRRWVPEVEVLDVMANRVGSRLELSLRLQRRAISSESEVMTLPLSIGA